MKVGLKVGERRERRKKEKRELNRRDGGRGAN